MVNVGPSKKWLFHCVSVVENYISEVQKKFGVRELDEEMIEMGLRVREFFFGRA